MPGLSAKVFRTFNASVTLEKELPHEVDENIDTQAKLLLYNDANRKVAILCNHQRTAPKSFDVTVDKMQLQLDQLKDQVKELTSMKNAIKKGKTDSIKLKNPDLDEDANDKKAQAHRFTKVPTLEQVEKKIDNWQKKAKTLEMRLRDKVL